MTILKTLFPLLCVAVLAGCSCPKPPENLPTCRSFIVEPYVGSKPDLWAKDEPYWRCDGEWCNIQSDSLPPGVDAAAVTNSIEQFCTDAHAAGARAWLNFSEPEMRWLRQEIIPWPANADLVSMDRYMGVCGWPKTETFFAQVIFSLRPGQRAGIVVEGRDPRVVRLAIAFANENPEVERVVLFGNKDWGEWPMDPESQYLMDTYNALPACK